VGRLAKTLGTFELIIKKTDGNMSGRGTEQNSGLFSPLFGLLLFTISVVLKFKGCYLFVEIARIP